MLEQSERDFPEDYNPPARLAIAYRAMKKWDEALAASDRALSRVYGPRKIVVLQARADIYAKKGDLAAAKKTWGEALATAEALPKEQRSERQEDDADHGRPPRAPRRGAWLSGASRWERTNSRSTALDPMLARKRKHGGRSRKSWPSTARW